MPTAPKCILLQETPLEIRLRIYEFVLAQDEAIQLTYSEASRRLIRTRPLPLGPLTCLNLLLVCRQIRFEAAQVFTSINRLKLNVPVLGQYLKLVQGQGVCDESLVPALDVLTTWLRWSADRSTRVEIQLGCWFTWWERSTADVVASAMKRLLDAVKHGNAKVTVAMSVNWTATPGVHGGFDVELPLWDLAEGRRRIDERIERQREQVHNLVHQFCLWENVSTCQKKFDHLFRCLDEPPTREELLEQIF
ncbi:hypothetical protein CKM354_000956200 [Cercospora kikuchii]|uniref:Uncharacterized protein n=1 Tax=Cercospora kikuchii TaxID=84275 RepID=A0A9P3CPP0_9PEZI|nr:uncharacterized protein CKM354_000956200 [Cercospora kikuchii]GIZ46436.1 hypothetical protein CKM354_000956200 [Cercospora kikuchii]